ncbi:ribosome-associated translation inhibitor RaiA [Prosthecochloris sp. N3]|uniref:Ribosome-associated translation inhibitor RaiA n=1 Tax=Prosthecochloris ethylica TaxID=2743976 RepID=A0ABR9XQ41_9CHLB|nr:MULTISPECIES: ribosome-associated translation inhibitor RaiA [Prosthecochloris]MBF0586497.1 ribosome-associated translation inhibitor RaiA [Prosthecochloris ethylica]MBF0636110.1 ribosome-associated translation inhibitor RaiA [Prosthecochloris ethylica]NUK47753.1 ribosome-associated translation inhibitor RaiA [Prosthecochloris ethylica]RNA64414.1 ribosome-associated translation inhibitor RaiA [Prosthecochloris sp. ZM_2]
MTKTDVKEAVNIQVTLRHSSNHHDIEQYARDAVESLDKVFGGIVSIHVILDHQKNDYENNKLAEVTLHVPQQVLVAKEAAATYEQAIDSCKDSLGRQLKKYKDKLQSHK